MERVLLTKLQDRQSFLRIQILWQRALLVGATVTVIKSMIDFCRVLLPVQTLKLFIKTFSNNPKSWTAGQMVLGWC